MRNPRDQVNIELWKKKFSMPPYVSRSISLGPKENVIANK